MLWSKGRNSLVYFVYHKRSVDINLYVKYNEKFAMPNSLEIQEIMFFKMCAVFTPKNENKVNIFSSYLNRHILQSNLHGLGRSLISNVPNKLPDG